MAEQQTPPKFVTYGKTGEGDAYSVRTADGAAVCTCAYNPGRGDREEWARLITDALNAYTASITQSTKEP